MNTNTLKEKSLSIAHRIGWKLDASSILVILFAFLASLSLVVTMGMGFKWFFVGFVALNAICVSFIFPNFRLIVILVLTACIPIGLQLNIFDLSNKYSVVGHFGGAPDTLIIHLIDFPIAILFVIWMADLSSKKIILPKWETIDTYIVLFLLVSSFSLFNTEEYRLFFFELFRYLKFYLLLWILRSYMKDPIFVQYSLYVIVLVAGLQFLVACMQYFFFFTLPFSVGGVTSSQYEIVNNVVIQRVSGLVGYCNTFASYLLFPITISFALLLSKSKLAIKLLAVGLFIASCIALVLTFSRNGWMTTFLAIALFIVIGIATKRISGGLVLGMIALSLVVLAVLIASGVFEVILVRVLEDEGQAYDSRWDLINIALNMIYSHPVIGIGLNSFEENMMFYDESGITNVIQQAVHNIFLLIAAETGIPSLLLFLLICKSVAGYVLDVIKEKDENNFVLGTSCGIGLLMLMVFNIFDVTMRKDSIIAMCILVISMIIATVARKKENAAQPVLSETLVDNHRVAV
jgi:O-antigen ligase